MSGSKIRVDITYTYNLYPGTYNYSISPSGCFNGDYSYKKHYGDLYLLHGGGQTYLSGGWNGYNIKTFNVVELGPCETTEKYDCINKACIKSSVFKTPGVYDSLAACEAQCGSGCSGTCISNSDWAEIEKLANQLKKDCSDSTKSFNAEESPPDSNKKYDCINKACIESSQYKTPGIYNSLSICEIACGTGCSGKCISNSDWAKIEQLASQVRQKKCF